MALRPLLALLLLAPALEAGDEPRHVLALWDSAGMDPEGPADNPIHQLFQMPLNHLGLVVRIHDVRAGPPPAAWRPHLRGVLTFLGSDEPPPDWLWPWLQQEAGPGKMRVVHLGTFGPLAKDEARLERWLARFGLAGGTGYVRDPLRVQVSWRDPRLCAYEADPRVRRAHVGPFNLSEANRVWVLTRDRAVPGQEYVPVVTGRWGGIALDPYVAHGGGDDDERRWHLDPFAFFREAFGMEGVPAPDPSVLNGRRMFFLHVDGDGFESLSTVRPGDYAAAVFRDEILLRYRLPYSVSIIVRGLTDDYLIEEPNDRMRLAQEIFRLDHVEPASHGVLHPLMWNKGTTWYPALKNYNFDAVGEVRDSIAFINRHLAPEDKPCRFMFWTGEANPPIAAIEEPEININGGVFRWDRWFDSVGFVSAWGLLQGDTLQVYAGAANENDFDGFFDTMPGAFGHIDATVERTGRPRILKPANLYVHFYSAERPERLRALQRLVERWAFKEPTAPVYASRYVRAVVSAVKTVRVEKTDDGWRFTGCGACRTMRIDGETRDVAWDQSPGVLGARRMLGALYLHLNGDEAAVVLEKDAPAAPHVEQANCELVDAARDANSVTATATGPHAKVVVFAGFRAYETVRVAIGESAAPSRADKDGRIEVKLDAARATRVRVYR